MVNVRCQAKNPALCTDPQCPERRNYRHQMETATNFSDFSAARDRQHADQMNQQRASFASNYPKPAPRPGQQPASPAPRSGSPVPGPRPVKPNPGPRPSNQNAYPTKRYQETNRNGDPIIKFHKDLGFPNGYQAPQGTRQLEYSAHAIAEGEKDRYGRIPTLPSVNLSKMDLIELKVNARTKQVERMLFRGELDEENDICLVLSPMGRTGKLKVVTQWINQANDDHSSFLKKDEYVDLRRSA